ncbi:hypothetical protein HDV00_009464 [Rhizophlyctis rosea]|nr:hypothetical protein HDV00_009464 [Rhizophlyctis rosea]
MHVTHSLLVALYAALLLLVQSVTAQNATIMTHKVLYLANADANTDRQAVENALLGYDISWDTILIPQAGYNGTLPLYDASGNPQYSSIIIQPGQLQYDYGVSGWLSALTADQWTQLETYESTHRVRRISLDDSPRPEHNTVVANPTLWGCCNTGITQNLTLTLPSSFSYMGLVNNSVLPTTGLYHVPASITNTTTTTPFLMFSPSSDGGFAQSTVGGVVVKYDSGREVMAFYIDFGWWSPTSTFLSHIYIPWMTRQLYQGFRRIYFQLQVDDMFLATTVPATGSVKEYDYRVDSASINNVWAWQKTLQTNVLPAGSSFKLVVGFNGNGVLEQIDSPYMVEIDNDQGAYDYIQPLGAGTQVWPKDTAPYKGFTATESAKDPLWVTLFGSQSAMANFWWCSHTFTHEMLNNCSRYDVDNELSFNILFANVSGLTKSPAWTGATMITPSISGLRNGDAIRSMVAHNITMVVGDTSRPDICNSTNPHHPWITTQESSNYDGFIVIPRQPTVIYYCSSTPTEDIALYNSFYNTTQGFKDWSYLLDVESDRVLALLLNLRHESYMFHQANLRNSDQPSITLNGRTGKYSVLQQWAEHVLGKLLALVKWPIVGGASFDELNAAFVRRFHGDNCGVWTSYEKNATHILAVRVEGNGGCTVPVTVPEGIVKDAGNSGWEFEKLGVDPLTVWVPVVKGGVQRVVLSPAVEL